MSNVVPMLERQVALAAFPEVRLTETALFVEQPLTFERWSALGEVLKFFERSSAWLLGEWAVYGERAFGESYAQAISEESGYAVESVKVAQWVAERVPPERRHPDLSWAHHRAVAALEPEDQHRWLELAAAENLSTRELYNRSHDRPDDEPDPSPAPKVVRENLSDALGTVLRTFVDPAYLDECMERVMQVLKSHGLLE